MLQAVAVIAPNWKDANKPAEIFYIDSLPDPDATALMNNLVRWVGQEWLFENLGEDAALANRVDQLPRKLQVFFHPRSVQYSLLACLENSWHGCGHAVQSLR